MKKILISILLSLSFIAVPSIPAFAESNYYDFQQIIDSQEYLDSLGVSVPEDIKEICEDAGEEYGLCPEILEAIAWKESRYVQYVSNGNCVGLCGVNTIYHADRIGGDMYDKEINIYTAADYIDELFDKYEDPVIVLNAYGGYGPTSSDTSYSNKILKISGCLERVHGK